MFSSGELNGLFIFIAWGVGVDAVKFDLGWEVLLCLVIKSEIPGWFGELVSFSLDAINFNSFVSTGNDFIPTFHVVPTFRVISKWRMVTVTYYRSQSIYFN